MLMDEPRYFILFAVYTPLTIWRYGPKAWFWMVVKDGWKCALSLLCPDIPCDFRRL